jgi:hypothetical protein
MYVSSTPALETLLNTVVGRQDWLISMVFPEPETSSWPRQDEVE